MYILTSGITFILCLLSASVAHPPPRPPPSSHDVRFRKIVVFGDSLSDTGNAFELTGKTWPIPGYYWKGRFSNGPNWVDQLDVRGVDDYAYGSATTDNVLVQGYTKAYTIPVPGMRQQIQNYLSKNPVNRIDFARTLYIFWGGGNDFIFNPTLTPPVIVGSLYNGVKDLLAVGAKNILVFNQVPVQTFPYVRPYNNDSLFIQLTAAANYFITNLLKPIQLSYPNASLNIFDIYSLITKVVSTNSVYFTNTVDRCWTVPNVTTVIEFCSDPEKYVFLDDFHFTTRVHGLIAAALRPFLLDSYQVNSAGCYVRPALP